MSNVSVSESCNFKNFTATTTVTGPGRLLGVFVSSSSSGTLKLQDGSTTIVNTFNAAAATYYPVPASFAGTLNITVGGTLDACVFWGP